VDSEARALITNLLLGSPELDAPGGCQGGPMDVAIPDEATPLLTLTLLGVDCEETDERAFADVKIAGLDIRLGNLIELGLPAELRDGLRRRSTSSTSSCSRRSARAVRGHRPGPRGPPRRRHPLRGRPDASCSSPTPSTSTSRWSTST
jgi:hypothetical protein